MKLYATEAHWQTMDSAPKKGRILVALAKSPRTMPRVEIRRWDPDQYAKRPRPYWASDGGGRVTQDRQDQPALWAPLPEL